MMNRALSLGLRAFSRVYPAQKPLLFSGVGAAAKLADFMHLAGSRRPLVVTDGFMYQNGLLDDLLATLATVGCDAVIFDGVVPNPTFHEVESGLAAARDGMCDAVLAVGGGSAIDTAKVIAAAVGTGQSGSALAGVLKVKTPPAPFYALPTTSGTGSEATTTAVITDPITHKKTFFVDPKYIPVAAALDPALLVSLPPSITASTGMDALTHGIETYTSRSRSDDTDRDALMAIRLLLEFLPVAYDDGSDVRAREMTALASFLAGHAFAQSSLGYVHAISHQVSARYNTPHGLANAIILPQVMRFNVEACADRYAELERLIGDAHDACDDLERAQRFVRRVDALLDRLDIPRQLDDLRTDDFESIAKGAVSEARRSYAVPKVMRPNDIADVLNSVRTDQRAVSPA